MAQESPDALLRFSLHSALTRDLPGHPVLRIDWTKYDLWKRSLTPEQVAENRRLELARRGEKIVPPECMTPSIVRPSENMVEVAAFFPQTLSLGARTYISVIQDKLSGVYAVYFGRFMFYLVDIKEIPCSCAEQFIHDLAERSLAEADRAVSLYGAEPLRRML